MAKETHLKKEKVKSSNKPSLRITPLNIVSAACLVLAVYTFFFDKEIKDLLKENLKVVIGCIYILFALVAFITDQIFRKFVPDIKKIWLIELTFIFATLILILIIKSYQAH